MAAIIQCQESGTDEGYQRDCQKEWPHFIDNTVYKFHRDCCSDGSVISIGSDDSNDDGAIKLIIPERDSLN